MQVTLKKQNPYYFYKNMCSVFFGSPCTNDYERLKIRH